jgi:hypothetical protein
LLCQRLLPVQPGQARGLLRKARFPVDIFSHTAWLNPCPRQALERTAALGVVVGKEPQLCHSTTVFASLIGDLLVPDQSADTHPHALSVDGGKSELL